MKNSYESKDKMTASEVLINSKLDFEVVETPLYDNQGRKLENFKGIQRIDNGKTFYVSKEGYKIIQYKESLSLLDEVIGSGMAKYTGAKCFKDGASAFIRAEVPSLGYSIAGDELKAYIYVASSHDGSLATMIFSHCQRTICKNLVSHGMPEEGFKFKHTANYMLKINEAMEIFAKYRNVFLEEKEAFQKMASVQFNSLKLDMFLNSLLNIKEEKDENSTRLLNQKTELEGLFTSGIGHDKTGIRGTGWAAYNAVTQYIDHKRGTEENREYASMFGSGADLREKAFSLLVK